MPKAEITPILSGYINARDNAKKSSPFYVAGNHTTPQTLAQFSKMIDAYAAQLFDHIPIENLAQMEALAELVNSRLNWMRNYHIGK